MPKKISIKEWIRRDQEIHGDKDDYSLVVEGIACSEKQKFICLINKDHKIYNQDFYNRINRKCRCPECAKIQRTKLLTKSVEDYIKRDKEIHGDKDDYSLVIAGMSCAKKQKFICLEDKLHGIYKQSFGKRIHGKQRCPNCSNRNQPIEHWIIRDKEIHGNKDDYSLVVEGINSQKKQKFRCLLNENHGIYRQSFNARIVSKKRCLKCGIEIVRNLKFKPIEEWIRIDKEIHGDKDDYSLIIDDISCVKDQKFKCLVDEAHGIYKQPFDRRINQKSRCPKCSNNLRVENMVGEILKEIYPKYSLEKTRPDWLTNPKTNRKLELDFYNEELKLAVEVQGKQHYTTYASYNNTQEKLEYQQYRDEIKKTKCHEMDITLIEVHHNAFKLSREKIKKYIEKKLKTQNKL